MLGQGENDSVLLWQLYTKKRDLEAAQMTVTARLKEIIALCTPELRAMVTNRLPDGSLDTLYALHARMQSMTEGMEALASVTKMSAERTYQQLASSKPTDPEDSLRAIERSLADTSERIDGIFVRITEVNEEIKRIETVCNERYSEVDIPKSDEYKRKYELERTRSELKRIGIGYRMQIVALLERKIAILEEMGLDTTNEVKQLACVNKNIIGIQELVYPEREKSKEEQKERAFEFTLGVIEKRILLIEGGVNNQLANLEPQDLRELIELYESFVLIKSKMLKLLNSRLIRLNRHSSITKEEKLDMSKLREKISLETQQMEKFSKNIAKISSLFHKQINPMVGDFKCKKVTNQNLSTQQIMIRTLALLQNGNQQSEIPSPVQRDDQPQDDLSYEQLSKKTFPTREEELSHEYQPILQTPQTHFEQKLLYDFSKRGGWSLLESDYPQTPKDFPVYIQGFWTEVIDKYCHEQQTDFDDIQFVVNSFVNFVDAVTNVMINDTVDNNNMYTYLAHLLEGEDGCFLTCFNFLMNQPMYNELTNKILDAINKISETVSSQQPRMEVPDMLPKIQVFQARIAARKQDLSLTIVSSFFRGITDEEVQNLDCDKQFRNELELNKLTRVKMSLGESFGDIYLLHEPQITNTNTEGLPDGCMFLSKVIFPAEGIPQVYRNKDSSVALRYTQKVFVDLVDFSKKNENDFYVTSEDTFDMGKLRPIMDQFELACTNFNSSLHFTFPTDCLLQLRETLEVFKQQSSEYIAFLERVASRSKNSYEICEEIRNIRTKIGEVALNVMEKTINKTPEEKRLHQTVGELLVETGSPIVLTNNCFPSLYTTSKLTVRYEKFCNYQQLIEEKEEELRSVSQKLLRLQQEKQQLSELQRQQLTLLEGKQEQQKILLISREITSSEKRIQKQEWVLSEQQKKFNKEVSKLKQKRDEYSMTAEHVLIAQREYLQLQRQKQNKLSRKQSHERFELEGQLQQNETLIEALYDLQGIEGGKNIPVVVRQLI
jgi:hypothetical protein